MSPRASLAQSADAARAATGGTAERVVIKKSSSGRIAPREYADAVAAFARRYGVEGSLVWVPPKIHRQDGKEYVIGAGFWQVRFSLRPGDPRLAAGHDEVFETVELQRYVSPDPRHAAYPHGEEHLLKKLRRRHERTNRLLPANVPLELDELGVNGLLEVLEKGDVLGGRGEYASAEDAMRAVLKNHRDLQEGRRRAAQAASRAMARETRRQILKIPFLRVGIELSTKKRRSR